MLAPAGELSSYIGGGASARVREPPITARSNPKRKPEQVFSRWSLLNTMPLTKSPTSSFVTSFSPLRLTTITVAVIGQVVKRIWCQIHRTRSAILLTKFLRRSENEAEDCLCRR
jgi:hypothetical protein